MKQTARYILLRNHHAAGHVSLIRELLIHSCKELCCLCQRNFLIRIGSRHIFQKGELFQIVIYHDLSHEKSSRRKILNRRIYFYCLFNGDRFRQLSRAPARTDGMLDLLLLQLFLTKKWRICISDGGHAKSKTNACNGNEQIASFHFSTSAYNLKGDLLFMQTCYHIFS